MPPGTQGLHVGVGHAGVGGNRRLLQCRSLGNFAGFLFYRNLTEPMRIKGRQITSRYCGVRERYWVTGRMWDRIAVFRAICERATGRGAQPGTFRSYLRPALRRAVEDRSRMFSDHYADESGNPPPREWFDAKLAELSPLTGESITGIVGLTRNYRRSGHAALMERISPKRLRVARILNLQSICPLCLRKRLQRLGGR